MSDIHVFEPIDEKVNKYYIIHPDLELYAPSDLIMINVTEPRGIYEFKQT